MDNDGLINYLEFVNFFNWKDKVFFKEYEKRVIIKGIYISKVCLSFKWIFIFLFF